MKRENSFFRAIGCLLLVGCLLLCGCPAPSDGGSTTTTTTTTGGGQNPDAPTPTTYANGGAITGTGDRLASDAPALVAPGYRMEGAVEKTSGEMRAVLLFPQNNTPNTVYKVTNDAPVSFIGAPDYTYQGKGSVIVAKGGFLFDDCAHILVRDLTLVGPVVIRGCASVTFENVKFVAPDGTAIRVDAATGGVTVKNCRIEAATAIENGANGLYVLDSYIGFTANGILDLSEKDLYVRNNRFVGTAGAAVKTASVDAEIRRNTVTLPAASTAIEIGKTKNVLVAENVIKDAQKAVLMIGADNSVIVRNSLISVEMKNSKHAYICDNAMGGKITVSDIDYILADGNTYPDDEYNHVTDQIGITNANGDSLMDVDARLSAGANEDLLPHVDRDQFLGEERKTVVRDPDGALTLGSYVMEHARTEDVVIVAPGAYKTWEVITLNGKTDAGYNNTTIYAYGMFAERSATDKNGTTAGYNKIHHHIDMDYVDGVTVKGGSYGYEYQGLAQGHVIEKIPGTAKVRLKAAAGFLPDIGLSDRTLFTEYAYLYRAGEPYTYNSVTHLSAVREADGTVVMEFKTAVYEMIEVGDVVTTELAAGQCREPIKTDYSKNVRVQDTFVFANLSACSYHGIYNETGVEYLRIANVYQSGRVISKDTYDEYKALEDTLRKKGFADFTTEVWYDEAHDCYRGPAFRNAGDGVHEIQSKTGNRIVSSLFERMSDDLSNQYGLAVRLSALRDNGDGTADLIYKGNLSQYYYNIGSLPGGRTARLNNANRIDPGDKIMVYTAGGNLVLDAVALTEGVEAHKLKNDADLVAQGGSAHLETRHVKVRINEYNADVLSEYLPYLDEYTDNKDAVLDSHYNSWQFEYKVYFHFGSYASEGSYLDNVKVTGARARATLIRTSNSTIKHCTFEHVGAAAVGVLFEPFWGGESAVVQGMTIENNLLSHTGYLRPGVKEAAAISLDAPGDLNIEKSALFRNITIRGNVIQNRANDWAIFVDGVDGVLIENNDLGRKADMEGMGKRNLALYIQNSLNVTVENNKFPNPTMNIKNAITLDNVKGLTGKDVNGGDMFPECK